MVREDPISKIINAQSSSQNIVGQSISTKGVKITSVLLDGIFRLTTGTEMKLSLSNSFGMGRP
jgi:hypothetical protein